MNKHFFQLLFLSAPLVFLLGAAHAEDSPVSIPELLVKASSGPEVKAAQSSANEMKNKEAATWRQIYVPKLSAGVSYSHLLSDQSLQLPPLGGMAIPPMKLGPDFASGSLSLSQVLFDPASMLYSAPATKRLAEAAELRGSRQVKETQSKAIELYLRALELRAKRKALEKYAANLSSRLREIRRIYELGGLSEGDLLKIKLGVDDANQGIRDLQKGESYLAHMIAAIVDASKPVVPADLPEELPTSAACSDEANVSNREDIRAIDQEVEALKLSKSGQKAEYLPKVYGFVQHGYTNTELVSKSNYDLVGVQLSWALFDGGVALANSKTAVDQLYALEQKKNLALSTSRAALSDSVAALQIKRREYEERRQNISDARVVSELEFKRLKNGKTTINNLIDAEDMLKDRTEKANLSKVSWYQAWFSCQHASGGALAAP
ncbi:MAG: TolC family protein [Bacteriovoracia bacterium]